MMADTRSTVKLLEYTGIKDIENKLSGDTIAHSFQIPNDPYQVVSSIKLSRDLMGLGTGKSKPKGGVNMFKNNINIKKTGSILLVLLGLITLVITLSGSEAFTKTGTAVILIFTVISSFLLWKDDNERKV